jgi:uncharacterized protein YhaN
MARAVAEQQQLRERRVALRRQDRDCRRQYERCLRSIDKLRLRRQAMFSKAGVEDEAEFRALVDQQTQRRRLADEHGALGEQIRLAVGTQCDWRAVQSELNSSADLEQRWNSLLDQLRRKQAEFAQVHQRLGQLQQELRAMAHDVRLGEAQLDLASVEQQIARCKRQWRLLAATGLVLESIRRVYETERQPETLNEASRYLRRLTADKYRRVWVPLGNTMLQVDDSAGASLAVELLSQGTREAVFLSLRLALAAAYARRGARLPLVLDDVLVNLDNERAAAAAEVLVDFAQAGYQILLFTCHEHIANLFQRHSVDIRQLPPPRPSQPSNLPAPVIEGREKIVPAPETSVTEQAGEPMEVVAQPPLATRAPEVANTERDANGRDQRDARIAPGTAPLRRRRVAARKKRAAGTFRPVSTSDSPAVWWERE